MGKGDYELIGLFHPRSLGFCHSIPHKPNFSHPGSLAGPQTHHALNSASLCTSCSLYRFCLHTPAPLSGSFVHSANLPQLMSRADRSSLSALTLLCLFLLFLRAIEMCPFQHPCLFLSAFPEGQELSPAHPFGPVPCK